MIELITTIGILSAVIYLLIYYLFWELYYLLNHIIIGPLGLLGKVKWGNRQTT